ncbi:dipeptide/oligopeptide/nickel ABC transporter ATP-binding protein [bacterium]|nr:dipeptide/oligopeptide/nickel ABC transporter ATP-binding protein [bacterium]MBU1875109.1 dipeptide/oligopeptide/nickel ABC transporter ATP-binding protein [bacterium]
MNSTLQKQPILEVNSLQVEYPVNNSGGFRRKNKPAVIDVSFKIFPGECFAIVGESGCGKSSIIEAILGFVQAKRGSILFEKQDLLKLSPWSFRKLRPLIQPVFQDYNQALNPRMRIGDIFKETLPVHLRDSQTDQLLASAGLSREILNYFPHQLSGGQKQRVVLARALSVNPTLLLLDEPVTSQDLSVAVQIVELLISLRKTNNLTFLLVSHNLSIVQLLADRVAVMKNGQFLEQQPLAQLLSDPRHNYTKTIINQTVAP